MDRMSRIRELKISDLKFEMPSSFILFILPHIM
jgi:hypothetical protein